MDKKLYAGLEYTHTNESLEAIVMGLDVNSEDRILAIGGSGDQAFALLEKADSVTVVDINPAQIWYVRQRAELIRRRDYEMFLALLRGEISQRYFSRGGILENLHDKIDSLDIREPCDIFEINTNGGRFTKIYLSNAVGYSDQKITPEICDSLIRMANSLQINGLIYSCSDCYYFVFKKSFISTIVKKLLSLVSLEVSEENKHIEVKIVTDKKLTKMARQLQGEYHHLIQTIYRRI